MVAVAVNTNQSCADVFERNYWIDPIAEGLAFNTYPRCSNSDAVRHVLMRTAILVDHWNQSYVVWLSPFDASSTQMPALFDVDTEEVPDVVRSESPVALSPGRLERALFATFKPSDRVEKPLPFDPDDYPIK